MKLHQVAHTHATPIAHAQRTHRVCADELWSRRWEQADSSRSKFCRCRARSPAQPPSVTSRSSRPCPSRYLLGATPAVIPRS
jgi:hypothetical protein